MRHHIGPAVAGTLLVLVAACGGGNAASQLAKAPDYNPKDQTKCGVAKSQAKPLIVEWPSADRGELEAQAHNRGLVVVRYQGCEMQVLDGCTVPVKYGYAPITRKKDRVVMRDADDLYANIPVGAARFEAKLEKSGELDVDMTMVGRWEADRRDVRLDELHGSCDGATHVVTALTVGAFTFTAGADATVGGSATVLGAGGGAQSTSRRETINADGDEGACEKSLPDDKGPPANCGAMLRVEVTPLGPSLGASPPAPAVAADASKLVLRIATLDNGLRLVVHEDHSAPNVAVRISYPAGSWYDPPGRDGMAHLWEHLMFTATPDGRDATSALKALGATNSNGTTNYQFEDEFELVPSTRLQDVLAFEADRMTNVAARIDQQKLSQQRESVKSEIARSGATTWAQADAAVVGALFAADSAYRHQTIGVPSMLDAITLDEAKHFYAQRYGPTFTTVVLAGDVDLAHALPLAQAAFGSIPRVQRTAGMNGSTTGGGVTGEHRVEIAASGAESQLTVAWATPGHRAPGDAELDVAAAVLTQRLRAQLVTGSYAASDVSAWQESNVGTSRFVVTAKMRPGHRPDEALRRLDAELASLREGGPSEPEITTARGPLLQVTTDLMGKATLARDCLGMVRDGESCADKIQARYAGITAAAVRDAVKGLLPQSGRVVVATAAGK